MKKYLGLSVLLTLLCLLGICGYNFLNNSLNKETKIIENQTKEKENISGYNSLAIMLQNENGGYDLKEMDTWPTDGYVFNDVLSSCENGGKLSWNDGKITLKTSGSDKCYVYFDIMPIIQQNLQMLVNASKNMDKTNQGELIKHDGSIMGLNYNNKDFLSIADNYKGTYKSIDDLIKFSEYQGIFYLTSRFSQEQVDTDDFDGWDFVYDTFSVAVKAAIEEGYITIKESTLDAGDNGYRYSGNNPNNFICFGSGSEAYNGGGSICPTENQYRIIGIVPVIKSDGSSDTLVKVIKSEYATSNDLGGLTSKSLTMNNSYKNLARVQTNDGLVGFYWSGSSDNRSNEWSNSTLKEALNGTYLNTTIGNDWKGKIETVQWNVGGADTNEYTPSQMREKEESSEPKTNAQIGLMYAYDYGYASYQNSWKETLSIYNNYFIEIKNRENNWLFNGVTEWTILREYNSNSAFYIYNTGYMSRTNVSSSNGVRPVFYLKSDVKIINDKNTDGTYLHPYRIG